MNSEVVTMISSPTEPTFTSIMIMVGTGKAESKVTLRLDKDRKVVERRSKS